MSLATRNGSYPATLEPAGQGFSFGEMQSMAESVAKSRLFPGIQTPEQAFTLMMLCQAEGIHPMQAVREYHIFQGRPSMRADAMQAKFQAKGGRIQWIQTDAEACEARFSHPTHCPEGVTVRFAIEDARKAGLTNKDIWKNYAPNMLRARVVTNGVRMVMPGILVGIYTPEEIEESIVHEVTAVPVSAPVVSARAYERPTPPKPGVPDAEKAPDKITLASQVAEGYDPRPYVDVIRDEMASVRAALSDFGEQPPTRPYWNRHVVKTAMDAGLFGGFGENVQPTAAQLTEAAQDLYASHRDVIRAAIKAFGDQSIEAVATKAKQAELLPTEEG